MADWKTVAGDGYPPCDGHTTFIGINSAGYACCFNAMQGGTCVMETAEGRHRQMSDLRDWRLLDRPALGVRVDADARMRHDYPILQQFHTKHALGALAAPSCLCCGQQTGSDRPIAVQHMELPAIVVCKQCKDASGVNTSDKGQS